MADDSRLTDALLATGTVALFFFGVCYAAYRLVVRARRQSKSAYIVAVALAPFIAMGQVVDPDFRIVQEAKQLKKREEDNPGDPPHGEDEGLASQEVQVIGELKHDELAEVAAAKKSRIWYPVLVRAIALVLGLMALTTAVVESMILFSDFFGPTARDIRESFATFEWIAMYLMSVLLLASTFQLLRFRKTSVWLFAGYLGLGSLVSLGHALMPEPNRYLDLRVTFVTVPAALAVLAYLHRLVRRAKLA